MVLLVLTPGGLKIVRFDINKVQSEQKSYQLLKKSFKSLKNKFVERVPNMVPSQFEIRFCAAVLTDYEQLKMSEGQTSC